MSRAPVVGIGLVLLVGLGVWFTFANGDTGAVPPSAAAPAAGSRRAEPAAPAIERRPAADHAAEGAPSSPAQPAAPPRAEPIESAANVALRVRTQANSADVTAFRWRFQAGEVLVRGDGTAGHAQLRLPPQIRGRLLVEAADHEPFVTDLAAPPDGAAPLLVDAFLAPSVTGAGVTLLVRDTALRPVPHVRVDAFPLAPGADDGAWHLGTALWSRRSAAEDGRYVLPELAPGQYGVRVLATDADGGLLPLLPFRRVFVLTGTSGYVEEAVLEPGCLVEFELVDATGAPIDPARVGVVVLGLHVAGGAPTPRTWTVLVDGKATTALDMLPAAGPVAPIEPVAAGSYELTVSIDGQQRVQQFVTLRAGERQRERIALP